MIILPPCVQLSVNYFYIAASFLFKGSVGDASQTNFGECGWLGVPFSPVLNFSGHSRRCTCPFHHCLIFPSCMLFFFGRCGWKHLNLLVPYFHPSLHHEESFCRDKNIGFFWENPKKILPFSTPISFIKY